MKHRSEFNFRGFVALADLIFAVSAGLLLLNPIEFESNSANRSNPKPVPPPPTQAILLQMQQIENHLDKLEAESPAIQQQAAEVLKNE
jgi:hypothetical protein